MKIHCGPYNNSGSFIYYKNLFDSIFNNKIEYFNKHEKIKTDIVIIIKHKKYLNNVKASKYIYIPIDYYKTEEQILKDNDLFIFNKIIVNSHSLVNYINNSIYLPHPVLYTKILINNYKKHGNILWIGSNYYLNDLQEWWNNTKPNWNLIVLSAKQTDFTNFINNNQIENYIWSPKKQLYFLETCKAVIDIKNNVFWKNTKPYTKLYEYLYAGIPPAMNSCQITQNLNKHYDINIPHPENIDFWFSKDYWQQTQEYSKKIYFEQQTLKNNYKEEIINE